MQLALRKDLASLPCVLRHHSGQSTPEQAVSHGQLPKAELGARRVSATWTWARPRTPIHGTDPVLHQLPTCLHTLWAVHAGSSGHPRRAPGRQEEVAVSGESPCTAPSSPPLPGFIIP